MNSQNLKTDQEVLTTETAKQLVDNYVLDVLVEKTARAKNVHPHYERLWNAIHSLYKAGGKRLRPFMTLLIFEAYSHRSSQEALPAAAAQELFHQGILIHDDIIDRDSIRYGIKNVSAQFEDLYAALLPQPGERRHFADSSALLAGDLLISEAHVQLSRLSVDKDMLDEVHQIFSEAVFHVAGGELLDTEASFETFGAIDPLTIAEQKTASYSFVGPLMIGAVLGGASKDQQNILRHLGTSVGIAYQLRDDIIGVFGNETLSGKSSDGDIKEGKQTVLISEFYKRATPEQTDQFNAIFGNQHATRDDIDVARQLLRDAGAKDAIEAFIETYRKETTENLAMLAIDDTHKDRLRALVSASLEREK